MRTTRNRILERTLKGILGLGGLGLAAALPASSGFAVETPPTAPITATAPSAVKAPEALAVAKPSVLPYRFYRLFVESIDFGAPTAPPSIQDSEFTRAELSFSTAMETHSLLIAPSWRAKEVAVRAHKTSDYGNSYYFPLASEAETGRIEGKITLTSRGPGLISSDKLIETFPVSIDRAGIASLRAIDLKGDAGSHMRVQLFSPCDFNIYDTLDISAIRPVISDELTKAGARVFSESSAGAPYSRPANALWIGADVPKECAELAVRVFSVNHGIPLKGVFTFTEGDRAKYFFNPDSITLGHSKELLGKPDLQRAQLSQFVTATHGNSGS